MSNTPSNTEAWDLWLDSINSGHHPASLGKFARAVLAKWGTQPQAGAVPQGWKAVPVNPTPEMWKAAKSVPDPNPPYPPHYGLVWDAMLAASPTPPAEQQAAPKAAPVEPTQEMIASVMSLVDLETSDPEDRRYDDGSKLAAQICRAVLALAPQQEPMAIKAMGYGGSTGINDYLMSDGTIKAMRPSEVVWAAPQPWVVRKRGCNFQTENTHTLKASMVLSDHGPYSGVVDIARNGIDELIRLKAQAKQDDALIRQLVEALEESSPFLNTAYEWKSTEWTEKRAAAITAARARLGEKPS